MRPVAHLAWPSGGVLTQPPNLEGILPKYHPFVLVAAAWAALAIRLARRRLRRDGAQAKVPWPPLATPGASRGVRSALRRYSPTCLERALVEQAWLVALGSPRDVVIGVPPGGMKDAPAHAWVDGTDDVSPVNYLELHRIAPRGTKRPRKGIRDDGVAGGPKP